MQHSSRLLVGALLTTVTLLSATIAPASALGETAVAAAVVDSSTQVRVDGTIVVVAGEAVDSAIPATPLADQVRLITSTGTSVVLTGALTEDATTGSTFEGTLSVPADSADEINEVVEDSLGKAAVKEAVKDAAAPDAPATLDGDSEVGIEVLAASASLDAPLVVVEASITVTTAALETPMAHTIDVAVVTLPTDPGASIMPDTTLAALTKQVSTFWASQSAGQVLSITQPAAVKRFVSADACDPFGAWDAAALQFNKPLSDYTSGTADSHLVVIVPEACSDAMGVGLGTVGSLNAGGLIWAQSMAPINALTLAHEFGHNLGLDHSNASMCADNTVEGSACADVGYRDYYDIMGVGFVYTDQTGATKSNAQLMALNVTQKSRLGALTPAELPSVDLVVGTTSRSSSYALMPASAVSGLRGLKVTDPRTGEVYFVEYRSGTGMDAGSVYASGYFPNYGLGLGVRVLQLRADGTSAVLTRPNATPGWRPLFMQAAQSFTSASGGLSITVTGTGTTAAVRVDLVAPQEALIPVAIAGTPKVGSALYANAGTWVPGAANLAYQWYRTGVLISGATAQKYTLAGADAGKTMTVTVTGSRLGATSTSKASAATAAVAAGTLTAATPTITGTNKVGYTLTANPGTWGPATVTLKYQWYRSGVAITGATAKTYALAAADLAKAMTVRVTGSKAGYTSTSRLSVATTSVVVGTLTAPTPTITGTLKSGYTLTANPGTWGPATVTLKYQWYRSGVAISGATLKTYKLVSADRYDTIKVRVLGTKTGFTSVAKYSASTVKIP